MRGKFPTGKPGQDLDDDIFSSSPAVQLPLENEEPKTDERSHNTRLAASNPNPDAGEPSKPSVASSAFTGRQISPQGKTSEKKPVELAEALKKIFQEQPDLPLQTAVLGVGEDGFPVLLDLFDPAPGSLVVIGDEREEQLNMLRSAIISLTSRGTPRSVQFMILSCDTEQWRKWVAEQGYERFCMGIEGVDDLDVLQDWILRLGDWVEQRRTGQRSGPPILLVLDTLSFLPRLRYDIRLNFEWMVKEAPPAQIWPMAAISSDLAQLLSGRHLLRSFHTRVLGFVDRPEFYVREASLSPKAAEEFAEPGVFSVQVGENWLRMKVPGR